MQIFEIRTGCIRILHDEEHTIRSGSGGVLPIPLSAVGLLVCLFHLGWGESVSVPGGPSIA